MKFKQLIEAIGPCPDDTKIKDFEVRGLSSNSRNIQDNFVFVAIRGTHDDGHGFIQEAIDRGAKAVIVQCQVSGIKCRDKKINLIKVKDTRKALAKLAASFNGYPSSKIKVIGITGTNGKTTVSYLIEAILTEAGKACGVIGTVNYRFKDKLIPAKNTTPGPIELQSMLADMLREGIDYAVMEVSSHALSQQRTEGVNFHSAIFTNLTQDHLDYHKTMQDYFQAKLKLFQDLSASSLAIINNDDEYGKKIKKLTPAKIVTYGIKDNADIMDKDIKVKPKLIGRHNLYNILAAFAWAEEEGIDLEVIKSALHKFNFVPGRLERIDFSGNFSVFVDYAHTEDALGNVIKALRHLKPNRIIVVFGCGGERDRKKRPKMARVVSTLADFAIITNDNPRSEDPQKIIEEIKKGMKNDNFFVIPERFEAIRKSLSLAESGDIILIAGKGHENYQILKDKVIPFDDREAVRECLKSLNY